MKGESLKKKENIIHYGCWHRRLPFLLSYFHPIIFTPNAAFFINYYHIIYFFLFLGMGAEGKRRVQSILT